MAVADKVKSIIVEQLGVDEEEVTPDASFVDDLGADSLDTVELVMAFEEEFGIEIPDEDAEKITRVKEAVEYIESHAKARSRPPAGPARRHGEQASRRHRHRPGVVARHRHRRELDGAAAPARAASAPITQFDASQFATQIAGEVKGFDPLQFIEKKDVKKMDVFIQYAIAASQFAMDDAGADDHAGERRRASACSSRRASAGSRTIEREHKALLEGGPRKISPFFIPVGDHQPRRRPGLDPVRRQGAELGDLHRLLGLGARHRRRLRDHPARRRRRR